MSHNTETNKVESEASNKSTESDNATEENRQEEKITAVNSHEAKKPVKSSQSKEELKERTLQNVQSTESGKLSETIKQKPHLKESSQEHVGIIVKDQEYEGKETTAPKEKNQSLRQIIIWTVAEFFDVNPRYLRGVRGIANLINFVLSLTDIILLSLICQARPFNTSSAEGFFCKPPETFLFIVSCCSFFTAVLYLFCCVFSKSTDYLLFQSAFEVGYFILYFILFLTAGMVVLVNEMSWQESEEWYFKHDRALVEVAATLGLINSIIYALSTVWFFMSHCKEAGSVIEVPKW